MARTYRDSLLRLLRHLLEVYLGHTPVGFGDIVDRNPWVVDRW